MSDSPATAPRQAHAFTDDALGDRDATGVAEAIVAGEISAAEAVAAAVARVERVAQVLNPMAVTDYERATRRAGRPGDGPFAGVPTVIKENVSVAGLASRQGSRALPDRPAPHDEPVVRQFLSTGAISLGLSRMPEFGLNATTECEGPPPTRNPWNTDRSTGGSSGGSAALVASGAVPFAHGNDGGGSIRIPAAACGLVGLKFTRGRDLLDSHARSMPVNLVNNGVLTRTVRDTARYAAHVERYVPAPHLRPIGSVDRPIERRLRIGVVDRSIPELPVDATMRDAVMSTADDLATLGHDVEVIGLPLPVDDLMRFKDDFVTYWGLLAVAIQHFGRFVMGSGFDSAATESLTRGLAAHTARRVWRVPGALRRLRRLEARYRATFTSFDVLVSPVVAHGTPPLGFLSPDNPIDVLLPRLLGWVAFTPVNNAAGGPAIALPLRSDDEGMPVGVHFSADHGDEATLLGLAYELEARCPFARLGAHG